ncbi:hypothetical protein C3747_357g15 [Trypanosoma cruzi]|uniref:PIH1D1/2/3 CS-like domain-containing protein n=2 Tax=Trypanosoma cruzi TaxID=5693 RepID=Q4DJG1_TRYCC|nr:hypothetical protein, conserved [Trypanosoma cruzi]EAN92676.1 hypothetical protein, conserved [Trypanosoma cruzi]PWU90681.1 hypothetical protein C3747_357g15 [Trypanosoma cruzi]RNC54526.1 hypothetical protein TcCL_ESM08027 [Trypanosoma cruzi]|eukprot:XP_814527.1 hypothetical protein [Trypanosoma cruzi strain CL Brener]
MDTGGGFCFQDISGLAELLEKNDGFKRPEGQKVGYSLQEANAAGDASCGATAGASMKVNPSSIPLPPTVVDRQLRLPIPSETREAKELEIKKRQKSKPKGYAIWTAEELFAAFRARHDATVKPKEGAEQPEHSIVHQEIVTAEDVYLGIDAKRVTGGPSGLLVKIVMPKLERIADLAIAVDPYELRVSSSKYYLRAALPQKVIAGKADAKWDSINKTLNVSLSVDDSERLV